VSWHPPAGHQTIAVEQLSPIQNSILKNLFWQKNKKDWSGAGITTLFTLVKNMPQRSKLVRL
jgi:hypothetical protein